MKFTVFAYSLMGILSAAGVWSKHGSSDGIACLVAFMCGIIVGGELLIGATNDNRQDQKDQS